MTEAAAKTEAPVVKPICRHKDVDANHLSQVYKCRTCPEIFSGSASLDRARDEAAKDTMIKLLEDLNANLIALQQPQAKK